MGRARRERVPILSRDRDPGVLGRGCGVPRGGVPCPLRGTSDYPDRSRRIDLRTRAGRAFGWSRLRVDRLARAPARAARPEGRAAGRSEDEADQARERSQPDARADARARADAGTLAAARTIARAVGRILAGAGPVRAGPRARAGRNAAAGH